MRQDPGRIQVRDGFDGDPLRGCHEDLPRLRAGRRRTGAEGAHGVRRLCFSQLPQERPVFCPEAHEADPQEQEKRLYLA